MNAPLKLESDATQEQRARLSATHAGFPIKVRPFYAKKAVGS